MTHPVLLASPALDAVMPMHLVLSPTGHVVQAGPTIDKLVPGGLTGRRFLEVFELRRPRDIASGQALFGLAGQRLSMSLRGKPRIGLKGHCVRVAGGEGLLVNLSFGISVIDALDHFELSSQDFAPTDPTIEMLYLAEANSAVMSETRKLNERLLEAKRAAEAQALADPLTGLGNRRAMDLALERMIARRLEFGLMHIDLDFFKAVNDTFGHAAGDHVLREVARRLRSETRRRDSVNRVGGDEFVLIFDGPVDPTPMGDLAWRLIRRLEEPIAFGDTTCRISASVGVVHSEDYLHPSADRMLSDADAALYGAKRSGRACVVAVLPDGGTRNLPDPGALPKG